MANTCSCPPEGVQRPDILLRKNSDFSVTITIEIDGSPLDLSGYSVLSQVKDKEGGNLLGTFICTVTDPTGGTFQMYMAAADCANVVMSTAYGWYDVIGVGPLGERTCLVPPAKVYVDAGVTT